ncbi:FAD binding domain protein [Mycobacterium ulcerans str. Harvey]|uniref:FAD binding domain protein n=1 Tax=Mycobacterium ulcerans str. Harvey TaxID=1299332 RepID=A0ABN0QSB4_MYCUL|nr:FAD binding domain protein [Mycobacterium ulcerans str. Harvey]
MMLGLLLARAGVDVTVMEKHADFLRDFRGDTVHASTLRLLDELGLGSQFAQIPHRLIDTISMKVQGQPVDLDLKHLPGAHQHIALVPQWDFLELLAAAAEAEPTFRLLRSTEVTGCCGVTDPTRAASSVPPTARNPVKQNTCTPI